MAASSEPLVETENPMIPPPEQPLRFLLSGGRLFYGEEMVIQFFRVDFCADNYVAIGKPPQLAAVSHELWTDLTTHLAFPLNEKRRNTTMSKQMIRCRALGIGAICLLGFVGTFSLLSDRDDDGNDLLVYGLLAFWTLVWMRIFCYVSQRKAEQSRNALVQSWDSHLRTAQPNFEACGWKVTLETISANDSPSGDSESYVVFTRLERIHDRLPSV